ncbi:hypothetical protein ACROYT_G025636 [Oculina patagonica]
MLRVRVIFNLGIRVEGWFDVYSQLIGGQVVSLVNNENFHSKLVPHGNNLFSIFNRYKCPDDDLCDAMLTWSKYANRKYHVTIKNDKPALWEIINTPAYTHYSIRLKWGCNKNPPHELCNSELKYVEPAFEHYLVELTKGGGETCLFRKVEEEPSSSE